MEMKWQQDDRARLVVITVTGRLGAGDVRTMLDEQAAKGTWAYAVLYDEREARVDLSAAEMQMLAAHAALLSQTHGPRGRVAIVVSADVDYGVNRMVSAYAEAAGYGLEVFRSLETAYRWLGVQA